MPLLACLHQAHAPQVRQVPGSRWLRHLQAVYQVADAQFAVLEHGENPQAGLIRQRSKNPIQSCLLDACTHIRLSEY
jgi:hypothetical protein